MSAPQKFYGVTAPSPCSHAHATKYKQLSGPAIVNDFNDITSDTNINKCFLSGNCETPNYLPGKLLKAAHSLYFDKDAHYVLGDVTDVQLKNRKVITGISFTQHMIK